MNNENILIEELDIELAREACFAIKDSNLRARAVACNTAIKLAKKYFQDCEIDIKSSLCNVQKVLENIEIADIYIEDSYIDVRLYFNETDLCIPKSHFDYGIEPIAYMFIKINEELSSACVMGFIRQSDVKKVTEVNGYIPIKEDDLVSYYDIEGYIGNNDIDTGLVDKKTIFDFLDGQAIDLPEFYQSMLKSRISRLDLIDAENAVQVFNFVSLNEQAVENESDIIDELENIDTEDGSLVLEQETEELELINHSENIEENLEINISDNELFAEESADFNSSIDELNEGANILEEASTESDNLEFMDNNVNNISIADEYLENTTKPEDMIDILEKSIEKTVQDDTKIEEQAFDNVAEVVYEETNNNITKNYSTNITPSLESIEESTAIQAEDLKPEDLEQVPITEDSNQLDITADSQSSEQIENLFDQTAESEYIVQTIESNSRKSNIILPFLVVIAFVGGLGYYAYNQFLQPKLNTPKTPKLATKQLPEKEVKKEIVPKAVAMPNETVENIKPIQKEESSVVSMPKVEQTVDTSIVVSNLVVNWDIPSSYASNNTAKRYLTKIGKIIQLDVKAELLLLNQAPITNKISLELEFNKSNNKFGVKRFVDSSGNETIDKTIENIVKTVLNRNFNVNMSSFNNLAGNPILVIRL